MLRQIVERLRHLFEIECLCPPCVPSALSGLELCLNIHQQIHLRRVCAVDFFRDRLVGLLPSQDSRQGLNAVTLAQAVLIQPDKSFSDILLHQAAKKFFDEAGLKKLPSVKSLQAEYAALLAEKKEAYADYRKARDDMKELLTVRANVQKLMGIEEQEREKEADRQEGER